MIDAKGRCRWTRSAAKTLARRVNGTSATESYGGRVNDERVVGKPSLNGSEMDKASDQAPQKEALHEKPSKPNAFGLGPNKTRHVSPTPIFRTFAGKGPAYDLYR
jgi:hypothetical protein